MEYQTTPSEWTEILHIKVDGILYSRPFDVV